MCLALFQKIYLDNMRDRIVIHICGAHNFSTGLISAYFYESFVAKGLKSFSASNVLKIKVA